MFRRRRDERQAQTSPMVGLRLQALQTGAAELGLQPGEAFPNVFGVVVDTAYPNGVATLVVFADGTTSLYTSAGGGIIGGGAHPQVVRAGEALLRVAEEQRGLFGPDFSDDPPPVGAVTIRLLTFDGRLAVTEEEQVLGEGRSELSPLFHAAHGVITELRQIDEAAPR